MLAFRRLNKECFCQGTKQKGGFATPFIISNIDHELHQNYKQQLV